MAGNLTSWGLNQPTRFLTLTVDTNSAGAHTIILTNAARPSSSIQRTNAVLTVVADTDGDGLPDAWEATYPNAANLAADTDQDEFTCRSIAPHESAGRAELSAGGEHLPGQRSARRFIALRRNGEQDLHGRIAPGGGGGRIDASGRCGGDLLEPRGGNSIRRRPAISRDTTGS